LGREYGGTKKKKESLNRGKKRVSRDLSLVERPHAKKYQGKIQKEHEKKLKAHKTNPTKSMSEDHLLSLGVKGREEGGDEKGGERKTSGGIVGFPRRGKAAIRRSSARAKRRARIHVRGRR